MRGLIYELHNLSPHGRASKLIYIDLARAKSEAVVSIYRLLKQNIKSSNAKRRRQRKRDLQHAFLVHFFAVVLHDYNLKLPDTS